jgi:peptidoglycan hydrolase-like protein with peptidoglycan-binding domain
VELTAWKRVAVLAVAAFALVGVIAACEGDRPKIDASADPADTSQGTDPGTSGTDAPSSSGVDGTEVAATGQAAIEDPNSQLPDGWDGSTTVAAGPSTTVPTVTKVPLGRTLSQGMTGQDVLTLQERLVQLKFDPGKPDGVFGPATSQAVWAFQKLVLGTKATGQITPAGWDTLFSDVVIAPRRTQTTATHLEVYLPEQAAVLFKNGVPELVTHISTGDGKEWCSEDAGRCGLSKTPGGVYKFYRRQSDWWEGSLGRMFNPVYFNYGIAVHGMTSVPNYPASHGCVRIPMHIAKYFPDLVKKGDMVYVFDGVKDPEKYGAQPPPFDTPDPNATTTTLTPPTTVPKTTVPKTTLPKTTTTTANANASTTSKPTTTPKPAPTTTVKVTPTTTAPVETTGAPPTEPSQGPSSSG